MQYAGHTSRFLKTRFTDHYPRMKSLAKLIIIFIDILNSLITLLVIFLFSRWKRFNMMIVLLKDLGIFSGTN